MKHLAVILLVVLLHGARVSAHVSPGAIGCHTDALSAADTMTWKPGEKSAVSPRIGGSYLGPQLGLLGSLGVRFRHIHTDSVGPGLYADAEADVGFWNELRVGAGTYVPNSNVYVGMKAGAAFLFETAGWTLIGMELGLTVPLTESRNWILDIDWGVSYTITAAQAGPSAPRRGFIPHNIRLCFQGRL
ncbi:MAG: hypothetical protein ACKOAX_01190 [Candidatus Kapaibacterium sp.]